MVPILLMQKLNCREETFLKYRYGGDIEAHIHTYITDIENEM